MAFAIYAFVITFLLIGSGGVLLFYREAMVQRIAQVINPELKKKDLISQIQESGLTISKRGRAV